MTHLDTAVRCISADQGRGPGNSKFIIDSHSSVWAAALSKGL